MSWFVDLRVVVRQHLRRPGFALAVVATLAVTIGATIAIFAAVDAVLLRALPYASPDRLTWIASVRADNPSAPFTLPEYLDYRSRTRAMSGIAALANWSGSVAGDGVTERLTGVRMSGNAFTVLGARAAAGRLLVEDDDRPEAPQVVVLSYRVWQRRFGGALSVIGQTMRINGEPFVVAGVLPAQFPMPVADLDLVTALKPEADPLRDIRNSVNFLRFFGRVADGVTITQAQAELTTICRALREQFPVEYARKQSVAVIPLHEQIVGTQRSAMLTLFVAVVIVLATALANIVSLALVRAQSRHDELTVRAAIGASRWQQLRLLGVEAVWLISVSSVLGWIVAAQALRVAVLAAPASVPRLGEAALDARSGVVAVVIAVVAAVLLMAAPFAAASRTSAADALRASRGSIGTRWNRRLRNGIVAGEIGAALVLLLATMLLIEHLRDLGRVDPGFTAAGVFEARVALPSRYRSGDDLTRFYEQLGARLRASSEVRRFGVISVGPLSGLLAAVPFTVAGQTVDPRERLMANLRVVSPEYLATVGTQLVDGRGFTENDRAGAPDVALINVNLARRVLPDGAVGRRLLINDNNGAPRPVEIAGVVADTRHVALDQPPGLDIYLPLRQTHRDRVSQLTTNQFWVVNTASDPAAFSRTFIAELRAVDPDAAVSGPGAMQDAIDNWLGPRRFTLGLLGAFALTALALAVSGVYGLVAFAVAQRSREIGVRMAVGASRADVVRMMLAHAGRLVAAGIAAGAIAAVMLWPYVRARFAGVEVDATLIAVTIAILFATVGIAAWLPARRAARIDPALALRPD